MGKVFDEIYANKVFYYYGKEIPVKSLDLESEYLMRFCTFISNNDWSIDGITYKQIRNVRSIGDKKARAIAETLVKQGVKIWDLPDVPKAKEPTRMLSWSDSRGPGYQCSNCSATFHRIFDANDHLFNCCPMCGKKLKW
jgi:hypothetical protein